MEATTVTSKGQVTIPKEVRQRLGIRKGTKLEFEIVGDHVEMRLLSQPAAPPTSGFGMLKSRQPPVPADFDLASLLR
jgi:AbrB family looped-hinge helix DNA binding protein